VKELILFATQTHELRKRAPPLPISIVSFIGGRHDLSEVSLFPWGILIDSSEAAYRPFLKAIELFVNA
jgi:hypothetical protein